MSNVRTDLIPTPTLDSSLPRRLGDFATLTDALDYAAKSKRGFNFYTARGELKEVLSFADLRKRALAAAKKISGYGLRPGERVALIADTSPDFMAFFFGCQCASVLPVPLPLPTSFGQREGYVAQLAQQMKSCGTSILIYPALMHELAEQAAGEVKSIAFHGTNAQFFRAASRDGELAPPRAQDLAYLQYSSGSTRFPHGIEITHKALMANCHGIGAHGVQVREDDRCISWLPFYHDMGLVGTLLASLSCQVSTDFLATEDFARRPLTWLHLMSRNKGTITYSPTFGYDICARRVNEEALSSLDLSPWRIAGIGADMIRPDVMAAFAERFRSAGYRPTTFVPSYGLAECTLAVSFMPLDAGIQTDPVDERILSGELTIEDIENGPINGRAVAGSLTYREVVNCGKPLPQFTVEIRNDKGKVLPEKEIGRVFVKGDAVMQGYYNDPEATQAVLSANGWLDTGDMGYMKDGCIYIVGRVKDMIIINGKNHWPQDIEWAVEQIPGVRSGDSAAISVPGKSGEETPLVLVQCRFSDFEDRRKLAEQVKHIVQNIAGVGCDVALVPPRSLPHTSSGKLSRARARAQYLAGQVQVLHA
ncbi:MAG TPA: fatty acyl-AMP ligase [Sphingomonadales bacterium]|nr:fatty acyl-AMP ligase [Sphingomonadales bacterium]